VCCAETIPSEISGALDVQTHVQRSVVYAKLPGAFPFFLTIAAGNEGYSARWFGPAGRMSRRL